MRSSPPVPRGSTLLRQTEVAREGGRPLCARPAHLRGEHTPEGKSAMGHGGLLFAETLPDPVVLHTEARPLTFAERSVRNWYRARQTQHPVVFRTTLLSLVYLHCCIAQTMPRPSHEQGCKIATKS